MRALVRPFQDSDFPKLLEIDQACFEAGIAYDHSVLDFFIHRIWSITLVLALDCEIGGFGIAAPERARGRRMTGHIITLDLIPEARGKGYGAQLLKELEAGLKEQGVTEYDLEVDIRNSGAVAFYEKMGYRKTRKLASYYGRGKDAWKMVRAAATKHP